VGAIATQAEANMRYGPDGLALLAKGYSAQDMVKQLVEVDPHRDHRQVGVVDSQGKVAAFTGAKCLDWAGHVTGNGFSCQGNILAGKEVVEEMARIMEATPGDLADRLLAALAAGQRMGGDRRGMQSAALYVAKMDSSYGGTTDRYIDIRVDDHPSPIEELSRIFRIYDMTLLSREDPSTLVPLSREVTLGIQADLQACGYFQGRATGRWTPATKEAWSRYLGVNNFENKDRSDGKTWPSILRHLHEQALGVKSKSAKARGTPSPRSGA
jgi:uncharacterized Ntn-hydrolase superfamily protein